MAKLGIDARFCTDSATGIGKHVYELIQNLAKLDRDNQYIVFLKPEIYDKFPLPGQNFEKRKTSAKHYSPSEQTLFLREINREHFDLMIFPHFNAPILYKKPFVVTIHDLTLHKFPGKKKTDWLSRTAYKQTITRVTQNAKHCFAVSENTKKDMIELLGLKGEQITVALNGVSQRFKPMKSSPQSDKTLDKYGLPKQYFLYTGVMRSHKNILGLVKAYHKFLWIMKSQGKGTNLPSLVIAGPQDQIYFREILAECDRLKLTVQKGTNTSINSCVFFPGFIEEEDINTIMSQAQAFVFPSFYEGFGIPPLEAMQCGVPTITSNSSSLPEVCGEATLYFNPHEIDEIAQSLCTINNDENLRNELIEKGFKQCQKFSWEDMTKTMFETYTKILKQ